MTFDDLLAVERHAADVAADMGVARPSAFRSPEYDRVEVMPYVPRLSEFIDRLAQSLGRKGYCWDVWRLDNHVCVSEREVDE